MSELMSGFVSPGFERVGEIFGASLESGEDLGASFCVIRNGEVVVDLFGGWADQAKTLAWRDDTIVPVFSTTKGIAALVLASIIDRAPRGYDTPVAQIWPDFAAAGKDTVTIGDLVSHQAGLCGFPEPIDAELWFDERACAKALAAMAPIWEPGTAHGYHPITWGYLVGEVVRRLGERSLGTRLREDFCAPNQIDFHIGVLERDIPRIGDIARPRKMSEFGKINAATKAAFLTKWAAPNRRDPRWSVMELPAANGHGNAKSVASLYGIYATKGKIGDQTVISEDNFSALIESRIVGQDLVLPYITEFSAGVMRNSEGLYGPNPNSFCHSGWGGSLALGDPDLGLSAAYVMNRQSNSLQGDPRARRLVDAVYQSL